MKKKIVRLKQIPLDTSKAGTIKNLKIIKSYTSQEGIINEAKRNEQANIGKTCLLKSIDKKAIETENVRRSSVEQKRPNTPKINFIEAKRRKSFQFRAPTATSLFSNLDQKLIEYASNENFNADINAELLSEYLKMPIAQLSKIKKIELKVDCQEQSLQRVGDILENISELKLNNSIIHSIRDIGTSFKVLKILWISRVGLKDISGMTSLSCVEELYSSFNFISDLFDFIYLTKLKILDLEGNNVKEIDSIKYLSNNTEMISLNMISNPISKESEYSKKIKEHIPSLKILDENDLNENVNSNLNFNLNLKQNLNLGLDKPLEINKNNIGNVKENLVTKAENELVKNNPRYDLEMINLLKELGISQEKIEEETKDAEKMIQNELNEEDFLLSKIKSNDQSSHNNKNIKINSNSLLKSKPLTATSETYNVNGPTQERKIKLNFGKSGKILSNTKTVDPGILLNQFSNNDQTFKRIVHNKLNIKSKKPSVERERKKDSSSNQNNNKNVTMPIS